MCVRVCVWVGCVGVGGYECLRARKGKLSFCTCFIACFINEEFGKYFAMRTHVNDNDKRHLVQDSAVIYIPLFSSAHFTMLKCSTIGTGNEYCDCQFFLVMRMCMQTCVFSHSHLRKKGLREMRIKL